ncbi:MAG: PP2C family protein-serine/threonine phosphatase, partial [Gammaproteobacteria bacterium]
DYYDYVDLRARGVPVIGIAIGDVSGHGVASALLMTAARALLHSADLDPRALDATLRKLNHNLANDVEAGRFMTLFILTFDLGTREITWVSAGHEPVHCYRSKDGAQFELAGNDIPLGVDRNWLYSACSSRDYLAGDVFLLATDGAWEARAPSGERFGKQRLNNALRRFAHLSASEICSEIIRVIAAFRGTAAALDDTTVVIVKVREPGDNQAVA